MNLRSHLRKPSIVVFLFCMLCATACSDEETADDEFDYTNIELADSTVLLQAAALCRTSANYGKTVAVFGGSLSCNAESQAAKFMWRKYLGLSVTTYGRSGYGFSSLQGSIQDQVRSAKKHDIFILWCSTNDYTTSRAAGWPSDYTDADGYNKEKLVTQCGGINYCIKYLRDHFPGSKIYVFSSLPYFETEIGYKRLCMQRNDTGMNFYMYVQYQKRCAQQQGVPYLDQFSLPELTEAKVSVYYKPDRVHLTAAGYANIAPRQLLFLATE